MILSGKKIQYLVIKEKFQHKKFALMQYFYYLCSL